MKHVIGCLKLLILHPSKAINAFYPYPQLVVRKQFASTIAVAEEDIAGAVTADERGFFTEVRRVGGDDWQPARITSGQLILHPVVAAIERTDRAAR
jgi:hypothetical protein